MQRIRWTTICLIAIASLANAADWAPPRLPKPDVAWGEPAVDPALQRMPPVTQLPAKFASQSLPQYFSEPFDGEQSPVFQTPIEQQAPTVPPGTRNGVFQKLQFTGTWIPASDDGDLGWSDLNTWVVLGFPFPFRETPLVVTPGFAVHYLDGPVAPDLPARVYDAWIEWRHLRELNNVWAMDVSVTTGYYSDFEADNGDAFRLTGRGVAVYTWSPFTKIVLGAGYFNRAAARVLPVGGLLITPNDSTRWELIFPSPRMAWRLDSISMLGVDERWFYIAGEFGGGVWAIQRASGMLDKIDYTDIRVLVGIERKLPGALSSRFEVGYVFSREVEYDSATPNFEPDDTLLLRFGVTY